MMAAQDRDISYVRFMRTGASPPPESAELSVESYLHIFDDPTTLTIDALKKHRVQGCDETGSTVHWDSVFNCIVGTIESNVSGTLEKYVINEGDWYLVSNDFKTAVDQYFLSKRDLALDDSFEPLKHVTAKVRKKDTDGYEAELSYNTRVAAENNLVLMDQNFIKTPSIGGRGFELCDLIDGDSKHLIHVKKGGRQSSVLSHFFNQGVTPINLFVRDEEFRVATVGVVTDENKDVGAIIEAEGVSDFDVVFLLLDQKRADGTYNIPFFSRITFYDRMQDLERIVKNVKVVFSEPEPIP
jgi:uncharacterized protein (TIGR04141 family)